MRIKIKKKEVCNNAKHDRVRLEGHYNVPASGCVYFCVAVATKSCGAIRIASISPSSSFKGEDFQCRSHIICPQEFFFFACIEICPANICELLSFTKMI